MMLKNTIAILSCVFNIRLSKQDWKSLSLLILQPLNMIDSSVLLSNHDLEEKKIENFNF